MMLCGIALIVVGCGLVGRRKTIKKHLDPGYKFNHEVLPRMERAAQSMARSASFQPRLHAQHHRRTAGAGGAMRNEGLLKTEASSAALCAGVGGAGLRAQNGRGSPPIHPIGGGDGATSTGEVRVALEGVPESPPPATLPRGLGGVSSTSSRSSFSGSSPAAQQRDCPAREVSVTLSACE